MMVSLNSFMFMEPKRTRTSNTITGMKLHIGDCRPHRGRSNCSGHIGLTVPDVKAALAHLEKHNVEVFKPLGVASNETIPVPDGMTPIVPGYADVYKQIAMIRVFLSLA
jgi:lactoylglutathione lyase